MYCPCGRSHREWLEQDGLIEFMQKDIKMRQLCHISYFYSGEDLIHHVTKVNDYGSLVHLGLMHYLSILYPEEIKPLKICKGVSVYHNIQ